MAGDIAARAIRPDKWVAERDLAGRGDAQHLAYEDMLIARGIVQVSATGRIGMVAPAVPDADVQEAVFAEMQVSGVVIAIRRRHVVDQDKLVAEDIDFGPDEARHAIDARAGAPGG